MNRLFINIISNYIGRSWNVLLSLFLIPIYVKMLGVESYGLIGFYSSLYGLMGIFSFGIGTTISREVALGKNLHGCQISSANLVKSIELIYWGIGFIVFVLIFSISDFISEDWINVESLNTKDVLYCVILMGATIAFRFPISVYEGGLIGLEEQVKINLVNLIVGTIRGIGTVMVLKYYSNSIITYFVWQLLSVALHLLVLGSLFWKVFYGDFFYSKFDLNSLKKIKNFFYAVSISSFLGIIITQFDKIILVKILNLTDFSYYSIATTVASSIWMLIIPFNSAIFPQLVTKWKTVKKKDLYNFISSNTSVLVFIICLPSLFIISQAQNLLLIWTGNDIIAENSYRIVIILSIGIMFNGFAQLPSSSSTAFGSPELLTKVNVFQVIIMMPLIYFLAKKFGVVGASLGWLIMNSSYLFILSPLFFGKYFSFGHYLRWLLNDVFIPLIFCVIIVLGSSQLLRFSSNNLDYIIISFLTIVISIFFVMISFYPNVLQNLLKRKKL